MKIMFISDIHGVDSTLEQALEIAKELQPTKIAILGDVLYHGPRNGVPPSYNPQRVAELLNANKQQFIAVRGNCDTEVDQMMLTFPILARNAHIMLEDGTTFFLTHGHIWDESNFEKIFDGNAILVHGHTHLPVNKHTEKGFRRCILCISESPYVNHQYQDIGMLTQSHSRPVPELLPLPQ